MYVSADYIHKILIHAQTSTVMPLTLENGSVISPNTLYVVCDYLFMFGTKANPD